MPKILPARKGGNPTSAPELGAWLEGYVRPKDLPDHPRRLDLQQRDRAADRIAATLALPGEHPHRTWDERNELQNARAGEGT